MSGLLTENLPLLAGAPNGIPKLRELILELAVRGRLLSQDSGDEPAHVLVDEIRRRSRELIRAGELKKDACGADVQPGEAPFVLPAGWGWGRIADSGQYINGLAFKPQDWGIEGKPIIRIQNLSGRNLQFNRTNRLVGDQYVVRPGDILVSWSATLDAYYWDSQEEGVLNQHIFRVIPSDLMIPPYLYWVLKASIGEMEAGDHAHGLVMTHINRGPFLAHVIGVPPKPEQRRIVEKIDELMTLCDRLEKQQADAASAHGQLVSALLGSLTRADDAADFAANWDRISAHFHTLFTTESSIDALERALLQLAVMGRLLPQDPTDESPFKILNRIQDDRQHLIKVGGTKFDKVLPTGSGPDKPFEVPLSWEWASLGDLATYGPSNGLSPKPASGETDCRCLTLSATTRGTFNGDHFKFVDVESDVAQKYSLCTGDLLIQRANSLEYVGVSAIYDGEDGCYIYPDLIMRIKISSQVSINFVHAFLSSESGRSYFRRNATGTQGNMPKINQRTVVNAPVPIPPFHEQLRIVAKVDELIAMCTKVKSCLAQARHLNEQLTSTLVERALA